MHSGHLDFVRGRQATDGYQDMGRVGGSTLSHGDAIADLATMIPVTTSAGSVHYNAAPQIHAFDIRSGCKTNISA